MTKKVIFLLLIALVGISHQATAQYYGVRVNALALATGTFNAGFEVSLNDKYTLDIAAYWNPVKTDGLQAQVLGVQPGIRRWLYESYAGHFMAAHLAVARYDVGNKRCHYKGWLTGVGLSYGYAWLLSKRWNLTVEAGLGVYYMQDRRREHSVPWTDDEYIGHNRRLVLGPSKCEVGLTYLF